MYEYVFGVRMCSNCPNCHNGKGDTPCQDHTSIEGQQRTGSLHAHSQLFEQCLHRRTSLHDMLELLRKYDGSIIQQYLLYKSHVSSESYEGNKDTLQAEIDAAESEWPEYKTDKALVDMPSYVHQRYEGDKSSIEECDVLAYEKEGRERAEQCFTVDVWQLQTTKQHHVHTINETRKSESR